MGKTILSINYSPLFERRKNKLCNSWMGGGALCDSFASCDFITAALGCKWLIKSILNKENKSWRLILLLFYCLLPQLLSLLEVMLINQLPSCLLELVVVCLFNQLLVYFLIKGDNVGSFPAIVNLAGHRLSSTTTLKFKIICNVCFCLATSSLCPAEVKNTDFFFFPLFFSHCWHPPKSRTGRWKQVEFCQFATMCLLVQAKHSSKRPHTPAKLNNTASYNDPKDNFVKGGNARMKGESTRWLEHAPSLLCCWTSPAPCTTLAQVFCLTA